MFVQVIRGEVADPSAVHAVLDHWDAELRSGATGFLGSTAGLTTDGELVLVGRFESEDLARQNSDRPEQDAWWSELEQALTGQGQAVFEEFGRVLAAEGYADIPRPRLR